MRETNDRNIKTVKTAWALNVNAADGGYKPVKMQSSKYLLLILKHVIMKTIDKSYYNRLNKAINTKVEIEFYSCVKRLSAMRGISLKRAYWVLLSEF